MSKTKPIIGISTGDPNGIGVEVILKCFSDKRMFDFMTPLVFSNYELVKAQAVHFNLKVDLNNLSDFKNLKPNSLNIYEASKGKFNLDFGKSKESGGQLSRESLTTASSFLKIKKITHASTWLGIVWSTSRLCIEKSCFNNCNVCFDIVAYVYWAICL